MLGDFVSTTGVAYVEGKVAVGALTLIAGGMIEEGTGYAIEEGTGDVIEEGAEDGVEDVVEEFADVGSRPRDQSSGATLLFCIMVNELLNRG